MADLRCRKPWLVFKFQRVWHVIVEGEPRERNRLVVHQADREFGRLARDSARRVKSAFMLYPNQRDGCPSTRDKTDPSDDGGDLDQRWNAQDEACERKADRERQPACPWRWDWPIRPGGRDFANFLSPPGLAPWQVPHR